MAILAWAICPSPSISNFSGGTVDVSKWLSKRLCQVTIRCKPILSHVSEGTYLIVHKAKIRAPPHMPTSIAICRRGTRPTYIMRNTLPHNNTAVERFSVMISMQVIPVTHSMYLKSFWICLFFLLHFRQDECNSYDCCHFCYFRRLELNKSQIYPAFCSISQSSYYKHGNQ